MALDNASGIEYVVRSDSKKGPFGFFSVKPVLEIELKNVTQDHEAVILNVSFLFHVRCRFTLIVIGNHLFY